MVSMEVKVSVMVKVIFVIATLLLLTCYSDELNTPNPRLVTQYVNMIHNNITKAFKYEYPVSSEIEFGYDADVDVAEYKTFDFIIVGAGTSGSALVYSLSKTKKKFDVLVIEAGGDGTTFSEIPAMFNYLHGSRKTWGYFTTTQNNSCLGMIDNQIMYPRGKLLGGTSAIDELMYVRGNPFDYDHWGELGGIDWTYANLLPYFKAQENSKVNGDAGYHAKAGPLNIEIPKEPHPLLERFLKANTELGRNIIDYNGRNHLGASVTQFTIQKGTRQSGGNVFLKKMQKNEQFEISKNSFATKILIDESKRAHGVEFIKKGLRYRAHAKKEVILAAGAINTPQLLKLSGIGPEDELWEHGIDVVQDLQVGSNLNDHPVFFGLTFTTNFTFSNGTMDQLVEQYLNGYGPYTVAGSYTGVSFIHTPGSGLPNYVPDIEHIFVPLNGYGNFSTRTFNLDNVTTTYMNGVKPDSSFRILVVLLHAKSKGSVTLKENDPLTFPSIDPSLLSEEEDVETIYQGILEALKVIDTKQFRAINATLVDPQLPGCVKETALTREYWHCYIRHLTGTMSHPSGTAKMGNPKDPETVVDNKLRVFGVERLRVADSSVIPVTLSGHITPLAYVIGAKAADFIVEDHCL